MLGASGKLGRALRTSLADVIPVFRRNAPEGAVQWQPGDAIRAVPEVEVILALWGVTRGTPEALAENTSLAQEAMALAEAIGARRVLHCSSAAVYAPGPQDLAETARLAPPNAYGQAKLRMERAVLDSGQAAEQVILRIGNVAGADSLFANMRPQGQIRLDRFEDGAAPERSYIGAPSLARVIEALAHADLPGGVVNVAAPGGVSMARLAEAAGCGVLWQDAPPNATRRVVLDTSLLRRICAIPEAEAQPGYLIDSARQSGIWP